MAEVPGQGPSERETPALTARAAVLVHILRSILAKNLPVGGWCELYLKHIKCGLCINHRYVLKCCLAGADQKLCRLSRNAF
jgi:hypothetical protein